MLEFSWWWMFLALPLPLLMRWMPPRPRATLASVRVPFSLPGDVPGTTTRAAVGQWRAVILWLVWGLVVTASAQPTWLGEPITLPNEGRELMMALDLSGSMQIDDMQLNGRRVDRLTMTKHVMREFITRRQGDRLGLILFADTAYLQAPMTADLEVVTTLLDETLIGLVGEQTAIGDAIGLAIKRFSERESTNKVIILLTDGQNTAGNINPQQALQLAIANKAKIYTIGVGADSMMVQGFFSQRQVNPSQELDERLLTDMAKKTGGQYFRARNQEDLENIYALIDELEPVADDTVTLRPQRSLFYMPLGAAMILATTLLLIPLFSAVLRGLTP